MTQLKGSSLHAPFSESEHLEVRLPHKPSAVLSVNFRSKNVNTLVVFLNGLGLPQFTWWPTITLLLADDEVSQQFSFLTYDRFGQGSTTSRDPQDEGREPGHGHDLNSVVEDLHELLSYVVSSNYSPPKTLPDLTLILVGNSIGCAVARQYAARYPGTVSALL